jgi:hypothetical protein
LACRNKSLALLKRKLAVDLGPDCGPSVIELQCFYSADSGDSDDSDSGDSGDSGDSSGRTVVTVVTGQWLSRNCLITKFSEVSQIC